MSQGLKILDLLSTLMEAPPGERGEIRNKIEMLQQSMETGTSDDVKPIPPAEL